jgi:hypothetical protein
MRAKPQRKPVKKSVADAVPMNRRSSTSPKVIEVEYTADRVNSSELEQVEFLANYTALPG